MRNSRAVNDSAPRVHLKSVSAARTEKGEHAHDGLASMQVGQRDVSDEVVVTYPPAASPDQQTAVFVPRSYVRSENEREGEVMVEIVFQHGRRFAMLPNTERDIVSAADADLRQQ